MPRPLRTLFIANDGLSVGHVTRAIAIATALRAVATERDLEVQTLLATTSEADSLLTARDTLAVVRLPAPVRARAANLSDVERRRVTRAVLEALVRAQAPDVLVVDTFPSGPHEELAGIASRAWDGDLRRVLVRRSMARMTRDADLVTAGLDVYDRVLVADDPSPHDRSGDPKVLRVPPITLTEANDARLSRVEARRDLGLPADGRAVLVMAGGGGDADARERACTIARAIAERDSTIVALALGPLSRVRPCLDRVHLIDRAEIAPLLAAFDGVFAPAGYNTAHELAKARIPAALYAQSRPFDDQRERAERFAAAGFAVALGDDTSDIARALEWMSRDYAPRATIEPEGARRAAEGILALVTRGAA